MKISQLEERFIPWATAGYEKMGWEVDEGYFESCLEEQQAGKQVVFVGHESTLYFGHLKLVWHSDYEHFRRNNIPEIKDLNVIPDMRRQGVASQLITRAETFATTKCKATGISVGLHYWYGPAQQLYAKLGYVPDGHGIYFNNLLVEAEDSVIANDELVLRLVKSFKG